MIARYESLGGEIESLYAELLTFDDSTDRAGG
jgi:hypothetical protein